MMSLDNLRVISSNTPSRLSKSDIGFLVLFIYLFIFTAIRYMVGWDYIHYYDAVRYNIDNNIVSRGEALTVFIVELSRYFKSPLLYFSINAFIFYFSLYFFIKKFSADHWLSLLLFISFPLFFLNSLSVVRIFTAIALVLYAYNFLVERKFFRYILIVIIASMFHKSALFSLTFLIFSSLQISSIVWFVALAASPFLAKYVLPLISSFILPVYLGYLEPTEVTEGTKAIYFFVILAFIMIIFRQKIIKGEYRYLVLYNIYMFGVCFYITFIDFGTLGHRLSLYSTILAIIFFPAISALIIEIRIKLFFKFICCFLLAALFFYSLSILREAYIPYLTVLEI